jgi:hypothetical protein
MLASKTVLAVTLAATFGSGMVVGRTMQPRIRGGAPPITAPEIYAPQMADLQRKGYDDAEMKEALAAYTDYLDGYQRWWNEFLNLHTKNLDLVDRKLEERLDALAKAHASRTGEPQGK